ncbi:MAG: zinc-dependent alcohol dehydrogenase family protein [Bacteroidetes bacterium]|nr:zinc-dependent alcohol dehydrogenase family protein [Bacteroidota bacterium]
MKAMLLHKVGALAEHPNPLELMNLERPSPKHDELLIQVSVCGVCHTELDEIEGRTPPSILPIVLGHQIVGHVAELGTQVSGFMVGDRVGVAWIFSTCGSCEYCLNGDENLCANFRATGRDAHGGYAEFTTAPADFVFRIPTSFTDVEAAPLLCAGAIGYRSLRLTGLRDGQNLGLTGYGASAHLVQKMVKSLYPNSDVYVFARSEKEQKFSRELGAVWAGDTSDTPPEKLQSIIDTTPVWKPVVEALRNLAPGGRLVINAIRKEAIDKDYLLRLDYEEHLWQEKEIKSVANVSRRDVSEFLNLASEMNIHPEIQEYRIQDANEALNDLKFGNIKGAKVLRIL